MTQSHGKSSKTYTQTKRVKFFGGENDEGEKREDLKQKPLLVFATDAKDGQMFPIRGAGLFKGSKGKRTEVGEREGEREGLGQIN